MREKRKKKKEKRKSRVIGYVNEWSVNDRVSKLYQWRESRLRCVLRSQRWSTIPGTRETAWHDEFVTGLGHATCFRLLAPSFFPRTPSWLRAPFLTSATHRVSTCDKFLKYSPAFYCPREKILNRNPSVKLWDWYKFY